MSSWGPQPDFAQDFRAHLSLMAKRKNMWIFSKTTKQWCTPEVFAFAKDDIHVHRGKASALQLVLMDPRQGLEIASKTILRASQFIDSHTRKMWEYYKIEKK